MDTMNRESLEGFPPIDDSVEFGPVQHYRLVTSNSGVINIRVTQMLRKNGGWVDTPYFCADTDCEITPGSSGPVQHPWGSGSTAAEAVRKMIIPNATPDEIRPDSLGKNK